ncbi:MAG: hypothetical protein ACXWDN_00985 [Limisphaerales bacterium]
MNKLKEKYMENKELSSEVRGFISEFGAYESIILSLTDENGEATPELIAFVNRLRSEKNKALTAEDIEYMREMAKRYAAAMEYFTDELSRYNELGQK